MNGHYLCGDMQCAASVHGYRKQFGNIEILKVIANSKFVLIEATLSWLHTVEIPVRVTSVCLQSIMVMSTFYVHILW